MRARVILAVVGLLAIGGSCAAQDGASSAATPAATAPAASLAYVGTYTGRGSRGIYLFELAGGDEPTLEPLGRAAELASPSFLAVDAVHHRLFAVNEVNSVDGEAGGGVSAFSFDPASGKLTALNRQSSRGAGPCHLALAPDGRHVVAANYGSGSVAVLSIADDGMLGEATDFHQHAGHGPNTRRQEGPHAHCVTFSLDGRRVFVCDLGLDKVMIYEFDAAAGKLTPNDPPYAELKPGAGPRHMAFGVDGRFAYVINELDSTVTTFAYDAASGALETIGSTTTLPADFNGENTTAEIAVHPSGKFLYASNRGHDSIAAFAIDQATGAPALLEHQLTGGRTPRHFAIDPTGEVLIAENQASSAMKMFRIDTASGRLTAEEKMIEAPSPVCLVFLQNDGRSSSPAKSRTD
jgi:6-phosphogluconolactonase